MDAVLFDIDDTIYDQALPFANAVHKVVGEVPGASAADLYNASRRHSDEVFAAYRAGERPTDAIYVRRMQATLAEFGLAITTDQARELQRIYVSRDEGVTTLSPAMDDALDWCARHTTCGVGLVTNGTVARQADKYDALGLARYVKRSHMFTSDELGMAKPDPAIFKYACDTMGARPARSLYVGDSYTIDVAGAHAAGMPVVWFNRRAHALPADPNSVKPNWTVATEGELRDLLHGIVR